MSPIKLKIWFNEIEFSLFSIVKMKLEEKNQIKIAQILPCDLMEMPKKQLHWLPCCLIIFF